MTNAVAVPGQRAPESLLINVDALRARYYDEHPDPSQPTQRVAFGTSGHRGSSLHRAFNEDHILAITQAICEYRRAKGIDGPLFVGIDSHALSAPAQESALEVLAANGVTTMIAPEGVLTPTPVVSHAILAYNKTHVGGGQADGIVVTPSHNPPEDGGFKYNPPNGGPADTDVTKWIEDRANALLAVRLEGVKRVARPRSSDGVHVHDFISPYVQDLRHVVDMEVLAGSTLRIGADPLGGANIDFWDPIVATYRLDITVVNRQVDARFAFMPVDHDGKIRMDCSSPYAMTNLVALKDKYDVAFGNDTDSDRHGIVTPTAGLMNPNHYLSVAIDYLFRHRPHWRPDASVGKTLVSSGMIDRVAAALGRRLWEVPVGFKWFVDGLVDGSCGFGGEESAGASFLRLDGTAWTTDKDGIIMDLLAAEITARTGSDPGVHYRALTDKFGAPRYRRTDVPATPAQKAVLKKLAPEAVRASTLAGEPITARLTRAPGNQAEIGGLKVTTANGWFAARPSGTEDVYKIYGESFVNEAHLDAIFAEAREIVADALQAS